MCDFEDAERSRSRGGANRLWRRLCIATKEDCEDSLTVVLPLEYHKNFHKRMPCEDEDR